MSTDSKELLQLLRYSPSAFCMVDNQGRILFSSQRAADLLELHEESPERFSAYFGEHADRAGRQIVRTCGGQLTRILYEGLGKQETPSGGDDLWVSGAPIRPDAGSVEAAIFILAPADSALRTAVAGEVDEAAFFGSVVPMAMATLDGVLLRVNRAFLDLWDFPSEADLVGRHVATFWQDEEKAEAALKATKQGKRWTGALVGKRKDGTAIHTEVSAELVRDRAGLPLCLVASFVDRSSERESQDALAFQAQLLESVREAVVAVDLEGTIEYWSPGAERLYGYPSNEMIGRNIDSQTPEDKLEARREIGEIAYREGIWNGRVEQFKRDGTQFWSDASISLVRDRYDRPIGFVAVNRDVTDEVMREKQLEAALGELQMVHDTEQALLSLHSSRDVAKRALGRIKSATKSDRVSITLVNQDAKSVRLIAADPEDPLINTDWAQRIPISVYGEKPTDSTEKRRIFHDITGTANQPLATRRLRAQGIAAFAIIKLLAGREVMGFLNIGYRDPSRLKDSSLRFAEAMAPTLGVGVGLAIRKAHDR